MFRSNSARMAFLMSAGTIAGFAISVAADDGPVIPPPPAAQEPVTANNATTPKPAEKNVPQSSKTGPNTSSQPIAPGTVIAPLKSESQNIPPAPPASSPALEGLRQFMAPDGSFVLPGGVGRIQPGDDTIGIQINTPEGPFQIDVPRRHRGAQGVDEPTGPEGIRSGRASREFAITSRIFRTRNYPAALRRVNRYLERDPGDQDLLQMRSLANFALGDYTAAYADALTALSDGEVWDWTTLRSFYRSADEYTAQYRALEDSVSANRNRAQAAFLFAYHNLMLGNNDAARREFGQVTAMDPTNETARRLSNGDRPSRPGHPIPAASLGHSKTPPATGQPLPPPQGTSGGGPGVDLGQPGQLGPDKQQK